MVTGEASAQAGFLRHGGRLSQAAAAFPHAPGPWLDLSTGINPQPWRGPRASRVELNRLPDPEGLRALEAIAARAFGVTDPARVIAVPGAEAGLRLLPGLLGARSVDILGPTYSGHEEAWRAAGVAPGLIAPDAMADSAAEALGVVNPNNPDGRRTPLADLLRLAQDRWLIVDESFGEVAPGLSLAAQSHDRLVVLRSFGKFHGLAGVRLGFLVVAPDLAARIRAQLGDWPVSAEAIVMGRAAYADQAWTERTRARLSRDAARLDRLLSGAGFEVLGGTALFRLAAAPDADARFRRLCEAGVLTRPFAYAPTWLRFGLPGPRDWKRLAATLEASR